MIVLEAQTEMFIFEYFFQKIGRPLEQRKDFKKVTLSILIITFFETVVV